MKKTVSLLVCAALAVSAHAEFAILELPTGTTNAAPFAAKVAAARVHSSVADGSATVKAVSSHEFWGTETNVTYATNHTWTVVWTNDAGAATTNTFDFDPSPYGTNRWTSFATNDVVTGTTNVTPVVVSTVAATNELTAAATCSNGTATAAASATPWIVPGERLFVDGTADGRVILILEK